VVEILKMAI